MLSRYARPPGSPGPKWDQLEDDKLTQADFYDDLLFPRDAFRLEAGRGYTNEQAMLSSMNTLHRALKRGTREEWKIVPQEDGSRVVRLIQPEQTQSKEACKEKPKVLHIKKKTPSKVETRLEKRGTSRGSDSGHEFVIGRGRAFNNVRSKLTTRRKQPSSKQGKERQESHIQTEMERGAMKTKYEAEEWLNQCGDFEPFSQLDLKMIAEDKKRYLERIKQGQGTTILQEESRGEYTGAKIIELFDSEGDGDDSDSSVPSFKTRIIRYARPKEKEIRLEASSTEGLLFNKKEGAIIEQKHSNYLDVANIDELSETDIFRTTKTGVDHVLPQDGVLSVNQIASTHLSSNDENIQVDNKSEPEPDKVENNVIMVKPLKFDKEMWSSMLNRDPSRRTTLGILDRSQWHKDLARTNSHVMSKRLLKEGYDVKMQKEASDRLSIPKYGPFAIKREESKQTNQQTESEGTKVESQGQSLKKKSRYTSSGELCLKQKDFCITVNENGDSLFSTKSKGFQSKSLSVVQPVRSDDQIPKSSTKRNRFPLRTQSNLRTIQELYDSPKIISSCDVSIRSKNRFPYQVKRTGCGDAVSRSSKNSSVRVKPDFDLRTNVGLNDRSKTVDSSVSNSQSRLQYTRSMVESTIVSTSEVNRRKQARNIDRENQRIMTRLSDINNRTQNRTSFRGSRREQLPLARIRNRAVTK